MDPKPIKRSETIVKFSREHHFSLLFSWKIRQGLKKNIPASRLLQYVHYFENAYLRPHFLEEEEVLFAPMQDEMVQRALKDHQWVYGQLQELYQVPEEHAAEALTAFVDKLDEHVRYEERELFPHLEKTLSEQQLEEIGRKLNTADADPLKDEYEDEFWK